MRHTRGARGEGSRAPDTSRSDPEDMQLAAPLAAPSPEPTGDAAARGHPVIDLQEVLKDYSTGAGAFRALAGVTLRVEPGELVAIQGRSGCGKSTLLNMITGIDRPTGGAITVAGLDLRRASENELARWRGRNIGVVFQFFQLIPTLTVAENIMLPMDFAGLGSPRERRARAAELLELVEMTDQTDKLPLATSGGQQQRIAIARALANDPRVVVADEPTGNLDSTTAAAVFALFGRLADAGRTVVLVTHDAELARQARRVVRMADGRIVDHGTLAGGAGGGGEGVAADA
jgi:putative ABC transport system ATP-binding protein